MRLTKRERVLIWLLLIIAAVGAYVIFYYRPAMARIEAIQARISEKESAIDNTEILAIRLAALLQERGVIEEPAKAMRERLVPYFNDAQVLRLFYGVVFPQSPVMSVTFNEPAEAAAQTADGAPTVAETQVRTVELEFAASYPVMVHILRTLATHTQLDNRVINFSLAGGVEPPEWSDTGAVIEGFEGLEDLEGLLAGLEAALPEAVIPPTVGELPPTVGTPPAEGELTAEGEPVAAEQPQTAMEDMWYTATVTVEFIALRPEAELEAAQAALEAQAALAAIEGAG